MSDLIYALGVSDQSLLPLATSPQVASMPIGSLHALYCPVLSEDFGPQQLPTNLQDLAWLDRQARWHMELLQQLCRQQTVVPFPFATVFEAEDRLAQQVRSSYEQAAASLQRLQNKQEWDVKLFVHSSTVNEFVGRARSLSSLSQAMQHEGVGKAFLLKKTYQRRSQQLIQAHVAQTRDTCLSQLHPLSQQIQLIPMPEAQKNAEHKAVFRAAMLIDQQQVERLEATLSQLEHQLAPQGFSLQASGPWPAYHFVNA